MKSRLDILAQQHENFELMKFEKLKKNLMWMLSFPREACSGKAFNRVKCNSDNKLFNLSTYHLINLSRAFTLAEVLITLGVIGILASLTIPVLLKSYEDSQYKSAYKKAYSDAANVWQSMVANYEVTERTAWSDGNAASANFTAFKNGFKIVRDCGFSGNSNEQCWDFSGGTLLSFVVPKKDNTLIYAAFVDSQGRQWIKNSASSTFGEIIFVDVNGSKKPNKFGKDRFPFFPSLKTCVYGLATHDQECRGAGLPVSIKPYYKDIEQGSYCNVEMCYYKSWLVE